MFLKKKLFSPTQAIGTFALLSPVCSIPARAFLSCGTSPYYNRSLYRRVALLLSSFENLPSLRPFRFPSQGTETFLTVKEGVFLPLRLSCKESSTFSPSPSSSGSGDVTALLGAQNRCALRLADHQRSSPCYAGWDRLIIACFWSRQIVRDGDRRGDGS